jgi:hypothetical protein
MRGRGRIWFGTGLGVLGVLVAAALSADVITIENGFDKPVVVCVRFQRCVTAAAHESVGKTIFITGSRMRVRVEVGGQARDVECETPPGSSVLSVAVKSDASVRCGGS